MTASGAYLQLPKQSLLLPATADCKKLNSDRTESVVQCATASDSRGTITGVVQSAAHTQVVNLFHRDGSNAVLVLTGLEQDSASYNVHVDEINPLRDGTMKLAVVESVSQPADGKDRYHLPVSGYDLVDPPGAVTLHRHLGAGAVALDPQGIVDWSGTRAPYVESQLTYSSGAWRVLSQTMVNALPVQTDPDGL